MASGLWVGYELEGSEAALHTVVAPTTNTQAGLDSGSADATVDDDWFVTGAVTGGGGDMWLKYDFGAPQALAAFKYRGFGAQPSPTAHMVLDGSDNDTDWTNIPLNVGVRPTMNTSGEGVYDFKDDAPTYRYYRFWFATWKTTFQIQFYSAYNPGELRFWGVNPYQANYADHMFDENTGTTLYFDGGGGHYAGWMFLEAAQIIDDFTITMFQTGDVALEFSDNGYDWSVSDAAVGYTAGVPLTFTPADPNHQYWRLPAANWLRVTEVAYTLGTAPEPEPPAEPDTGPAGGYAGPGTARSWRLATNRKWGRSQYWK
jgi:hypothetical protein